MNTNVDCYFFVDQSVPEEEQTMSVLCIECHDEKSPTIGWFYKGSTEGYGPFEYKCELCDKVIYKGDSEEDDVAQGQAE